MMATNSLDFEIDVFDKRHRHLGEHARQVFVRRQQRSCRPSQNVDGMHPRPFRAGKETLP